MNSFVMNGYLWRIKYVSPDSRELVDRTGHRTYATTDPKTKRVYLSKELSGPFLVKVLLHELGHCTMISYNLIEDIRRMVKPEYWVEAEEWACNFIADYGMKIFSVAYHILGEDAWTFIPYELERFVS